MAGDPLFLSRSDPPFGEIKASFFSRDRMIDIIDILNRNKRSSVEGNCGKPVRFLILQGFLTYATFGLTCGKVGIKMLTKCGKPIFSFFCKIYFCPFETLFSDGIFCKIEILSQVDFFCGKVNNFL